MKKNHANSQLEVVLRKYAALDMFEGCEITTPMSSNADGDTPFHIAAYDGDIQALETMLPYVKDIDLKGDIGNTPLHYAISNKQLPMAKLLIKYGASLYLGNDYGDTPMEYMENDETFSSLIEELKQQ